VDMTSRLSGEDTSKLGWNPKKWQAWYAGTLLPKLEQQKAQERAKAAEQKTPTTMAAPKRNKGPVTAV
jgi:hypothetical protein